MTQDNSKDSPPNLDQTARHDIGLEGISKLDPGLYITATPIGNLRDITLRALDALKSADLILCEDTRVTQKLLRAFLIKTPLKAYHDHNAAKIRPKILKRLEAGEAICLVSDAGTPLISDPGFRLVEACVEKDLPVTALPGASAPITALTLSALPTDNFAFFGFLPPKKKARAELLGKAALFPGTAMFFEAARRIAPTLRDLEQALGPRAAVVARELTKKFEEMRRGSLADLAAYYEAEGSPKGEIVILVAPGKANPPDDRDVEAALKEALETLSTKDAAAIVAENLKIPRKQAYDLALKIQKEGGK